MLRPCALILLSCCIACEGLRTVAEDAGQGDGGQDAGPVPRGDAGQADAGCSLDVECPQPGTCDVPTGQCRCAVGQHPCGSSCVPDTSTTACGATCTPCTPPVNAAAACVNGACTFVCEAPLFPCGEACCKAVAVTAGFQHSCLLTSASGVRCWGEAYGVGDGSIFGDRPRSVEILSGGAREIGAGHSHTCASMVDGTAKCWGVNADGSLGDGTRIPRASPVNVAGLSGHVSRITLGAFHTCALVAGAATCWGSNQQGQQGDNSTALRELPGAVSGLGSDVVALANGFVHSCAAMADGGVLCWGQNTTNQCGDGTVDSPRLLPVPVIGLDTPLVQLAPGQGHSCGRTASGAVRCWGSHAVGQCGAGLTGVSPYLSPVQPVGLGQGVSMVASNGAGGGHTCAVQDGGAWCWGPNDRGQLGNGTVALSRTPVPVTGLSSGVVWIATGGTHSCAVTSEGGVKCWGLNDHGQLGDGTKVERWMPVDVR